MTTRPGYIWSGTEWVSIGQEAAVAPVSYQASAPSTPSTGDIWIDSNDDVPGIDTSQFLRWRKTAVGGETSVSGTDDNGLTLQYTANYEQVYLNGVLLVRGQDYTATNGTSITGLTALAANDVVEVFGVVARVVGDVYTQSQSNDLLNTKSNVSDTGLVLLGTATPSSASQVTFDNVFSSTYDNYKVMLYTTAASASATDIYWYGRSGNPATDTTANYYHNLISQYSTSNAGSGSSIPLIGSVSSTYANWTVVSLEIFSPNVNKRTQFISDASYVNASGVPYQMRIVGYQDQALQFTGIKILPASGTFSGTIKVYGYK